MAAGLKLLKGTLKNNFMSNKRYEKFHKITGEQLSRSLFLKKLQTYTAQKMKFSIKDFYSKCDQIHSSCGFGHIFWRMENFIFLCCAIAHLLQETA